VVANTEAWGTEKMVYSRNKCLNHSEDYLKKQRACPLHLAILNVYENVTNTLGSYLLNILHNNIYLNDKT
jgi:hypothetical protein